MISPEEFGAFTQEEQIARLQQLGEKALAEFGVSPIEIKPLVHFENTTFYVKCAEGEFNLRISRPGQQTLATLESEIAFLHALREHQFRVPEPYLGKVVTVETQEVPEPRNVVLLRWMHGEFLRDRLTPKEARLIGIVMARLHEFAQTWKPPAGLERIHLHDWALQDRGVHRIDKPIEGLSEEDRRFVVDMDREARHALAKLEKSPLNYGLIHSDLHIGNILLEGEELNVIDFDDTGYGFLYYDFAAALAFHLNEERYEAIQEAMLEGYESIRPLPPQTIDFLPLFLRIRLGGVSRWILDRVDNPSLREVGPGWVHHFCQGLRKRS
ncbi:MAG: phosphotransferase [Chlorobia bacterium]|nr:phosphotransferase [Fimbriimonadaceae bacterium]